MSEPLNYEQARDELVRVVQKLEAGGTPLQESIELWERGEELATICQRWLDGARAKFDSVVSGQPESPPSAAGAESPSSAASAESPSSAAGAESAD